MRTLRTLYIISIVISASVSMSSCIESNFAHCVVVNNEHQFIGKQLLAVSPKKSSTGTKEACTLKDKEIDKSDGPKKGRVRWVNCFSGPDCDEAGEF